jgi:transcriptional regulator with GAF, ATPase, and Fis domain
MTLSFVSTKADVAAVRSSEQSANAIGNGMETMTTLTESLEDIGADIALPGHGLAAAGKKHIMSRRDRSPIVGDSQALLSVIRQAERVAATDATVLILGETGTGKELLAHHMHRVGIRSTEPFITTNIAAIPATLLESELFGRERGAYTGAMSRQIGRFEVADGGTLFLDEIGETPVEIQVKLLRVLEYGQFERLGSSRTLRVNVRVIAATNRKLPELLRAGSFRQDLFYRLNVFPLTMPPLRERLDDIPALVWAFIKEFSYKMGKPIERVRAEDLNALQRYHWPGNVRELRNVIERSMILTLGSELRIEVPEPADALVDVGQRSRLLRDVEQAHILQVLASTRGRIRGKGGAAEILGLKPTTLYSRMQRLGIERPR